MEDVMNNRRWFFNSPANPMMSGASQQQRRNVLQPTSLTQGNAFSAPPCGDIMSQMSEIENFLYLSGARAVKVQKLRELGITNIFNVTIELPNLLIDKMDYMKINIEDSPYSNLACYFDRVADKIEETRRRGGKCLVHCVAGVSRSASLVIAYLIKYKRMSLRKAYQHVKVRRHIIRPNPGFFRQLVEYEQRVLGSSSVNMVWCAGAGCQIPDLYEAEYNNTMNFLNKYGNLDRTAFARNPQLHR